MKKEVLLLFVSVLVFVTLVFFMGGGITGLTVGEEPRFKVLVSLKVPDSAFAGSAVVDADENIIEVMKVKTSAVQDEVIHNVNAGGLFSFMQTDDLIVEKKYSVVPALLVQVNEEGLLALYSNPLVSAVYSDSLFSINLAESVPQINASFPTNFNVSGENVGICIVDTGIDNTHSAFDKRIVAEKCFCSNNCCPNGEPEDFNSFDDNVISHGTHVSGITAGNGTVKGVAPGANIISVKVCNNQGSCFTSDVIAGIDFCVQNKFKYNISIISGSIGDGGQHTSDSCPVFIDPALEAAATLDIFLVFASGNNGFSGGINYPACYNHSISVGAVAKNDVIASFTNKGSNLDFLAPGVNIYSSVRGGGYSTLSGTSQAVPHFSGFIALLLDFADNFNLSINDVKESFNKTNKFIGGFPRINAGMSLVYLKSLINSSGSDYSNITNSTNNLPLIEITSPLNNSILVNPVVFSAIAQDVEDGFLNVSWFFENTTIFGNFSLNLSFGNHSVIAYAKDSENLSINETVFFEVVNKTDQNNDSNVSNNPPVINIISPLNNSFVGRNITLFANVSDIEDLNLIGTWSSDLQGNLGTGNKLNVFLNKGSHLITFSVIDSGNLSVNSSIFLVVGSCLIDFDRNSNSQLDIGDIVLLFEQFMDDSLTDISGVLCSQSGTCLFDFDMNNNSIYDIGDLVVLFDGFINENITTPAGENCFD